MDFKYWLVVLLLCTVSLVPQASSTVQNVHIALAGKSSMAICWLTKYSTDSLVYYGTDPSNLNLFSYGYSATYSAEDAGWNHNVVLQNLSEDTTYYYTCGAPKAMSPQYQFRTSPMNASAIHIAAYGDMGVDNSQNTISQLISRTNNNDFDIFLHMGDISYANDHHTEYEETWNQWFTSMEPITSIIPYMVAPGNHEAVCKAIGCFQQTSNFTTYEYKFLMPGRESGTNTNMFYSFDYGPVHFVAIDTESDYPGAPVLESTFPPTADETEYFQINWLHRDLTKAVANRNNVPWIVAFGHRPIYAPLLEKNNIPTGYSAAVQSFLEPILKEYEVDVYLTGHVHAYARTYPMYNNTVTSTSYNNPPDTVHICAGGAGNIEGISTFPLPLPTWYAAGNDIDFGFGTITATKDQFIWNYYLSNTGALNDTITITK